MIDRDRDVVPVSTRAVSCIRQSSDGMACGAYACAIAYILCTSDLKGAEERVEPLQLPWDEHALRSWLVSCAKTGVLVPPPLPVGTHPGTHHANHPDDGSPANHHTGKRSAAASISAPLNKRASVPQKQEPPPMSAAGKDGKGAAGKDGKGTAQPQQLPQGAVGNDGKSAAGKDDVGTVQQVLLRPPGIRAAGRLQRVDPVVPPPGMLHVTDSVAAMSPRAKPMQGTVPDNDDGHGDGHGNDDGQGSVGAHGGDDVDDDKTEDAAVRSASALCAVVLRCVHVVLHVRCSCSIALLCAAHCGLTLTAADACAAR
jgi:hypothetical protein